MATQTNPDLEARILANPDDRDAYLVYGDWLQSKGDPRGELIAVQIKRSQADTDELRAQEEKLIAANKAAWLGELAGLGDKDAAVTWRWGFVDEVRFGPPADDYETSDASFPDLWKSVMGLPGSQFVRAVTFGAIGYDDYPTSWSDCIDALVEHGTPPNLWKLGFTRGGYWDISSTELGDLSAAYPKLQNLRELSIELGAMEFGAMDLLQLRKLEIITGGLQSDNIASIVKARWPHLETLSLCIGQSGNDYGCTVELSDIEAILAAENLPAVKHLALANSSLADEIAAALPKSRILPRLQSLDLSKGTLGDGGADAIIKNWEAFAHLRTLDLSHGYFSDETEAALRALKGPTIVLDDLQGDAEPDDRYCSISE